MRCTAPAGGRRIDGVGVQRSCRSTIAELERREITETPGRALGDATSQVAPGPRLKTPRARSAKSRRRTVGRLSRLTNAQLQGRGDLQDPAQARAGVLRGLVSLNLLLLHPNALRELALRRMLRDPCANQHVRPLEAPVLYRGAGGAVWGGPCAGRGPSAAPFATPHSEGGGSGELRSAVYAVRKARTSTCTPDAAASSAMRRACSVVDESR